MDVAATIFSTGWASGVNSYATVLVLCLLGRAGVGGVPEGLDQNWVLLAAAGMFVVEFATDKVPFLDSAWDSIHTIVRPLIGVVLGFSFAGEHGIDGIEEALGAGGSGLTALAVTASRRGSGSASTRRRSPPPTSSSASRRTAPSAWSPSSRSTTPSSPR